METGKAWDEQLRHMITDFVSLKVQAKDEAALLWLVQRAGADSGARGQRITAARKEG